MVRFDLEVAKVLDQMKTEKSQKEKLQRERDELLAQKYSTEQELKVKTSLIYDYFYDIVQVLL